MTAAQIAGKIVYAISQLETRNQGWRLFAKVNTAARVGTRDAVLVRIAIARIAQALLQRGIGWLT